MRTESQIKIEKRFLVNRYDLIVDRAACAGCGQCSIVCPQDAILFDSPIRIEGEKIEEYDPTEHINLIQDKCVYCGTCSYFCPFDAIHLYENNEKVAKEDLMIVQQKTIPTLISEKVNCENINSSAQVYWDGLIKIVFEKPENAEEYEKHYNEICPGECRKCEKVCPTGAISFNKEDHIKINDEKCIKCGACMIVCPDNNYEVSWTNIKTQGLFNTIFWDPLNQSLKEQAVKFKED